MLLYRKSIFFDYGLMATSLSNLIETSGHIEEYDALKCKFILKNEIHMKQYFFVDTVATSKFFSVSIIIQIIHDINTKRFHINLVHREHFGGSQVQKTHSLLTVGYI